MRIVAIAAACGVMAATGFVAAQDRPAQQPGTGVTVTGCLQRPQSAGSLAGTPTGAPAAPNQADDRANSSVPDPGYILAGAREKRVTPVANARDSVGTSGDRPMTYALVGQDAQLAPHVGHTVEITGVVAPPVEARAPSDTPDPAPPPTSVPDPAGKAFQTGVRQLRVATLTMTAATCAQQP